jgi:hypothetical protein
MNTRIFVRCLSASLLVLAIPAGCVQEPPQGQQDEEGEEQVGSAEQAITTPITGQCSGASPRAVHNPEYPGHAPGLCPAAPAFDAEDAFFACGGTSKVKYFTYTCENYSDGRHVWTSYFGCCPSKCEDTGIVYETRPYYGDVSPLSSPVEAINRYNTLAVGAAGYGKADLADTSEFSNQVVNGGVFSSVATHLTVSFIVAPEQAGTWAFRLGGDFGYGGTLLADWSNGSGIELESYWDQNPNDAVDFFWGNSFADPDVLSGFVWLGTGIHQIDLYGFENGNDGVARLEFMAPNTGNAANWADPAWHVFQPANINLCDDPCNGVVCSALDQCHDAGVCNPATGACSNPLKVNGSTCNDGDGCTQTDTCQNGVCAGSNPVSCSALDQCHAAGVCNPATGTCSNPNKASGSACDSGYACTQSETCESGQCVPHPIAWDEYRAHITVWGTAVLHEDTGTRVELYRRSNQIDPASCQPIYGSETLVAQSDNTNHGIALGAATKMPCGTSLDTGWTSFAQANAAYGSAAGCSCEGTSGWGLFNGSHTGHDDTEIQLLAFGSGCTDGLKASVCLSPLLSHAWCN